jgi:lysophospholipase L1-like esterase
MSFRQLIRIGAALLLVAPAMTAMSVVQAPAQGATPTAACVAPAELTRLDMPLNRTGQHFLAGEPIKIVAIGSSSTFGAGASSAAASYPSRLEAELKALRPRLPVTVFNRGANGEEARDMIARFDTDVFAEHPDLVLWQVGSNAVLRDRPLNESNVQLREGLKRLRSAGADVILVNPQYAPKVIAKHDINRMVDLIDATARETHVGLFQRFALMRYWHLTEDMPFGVFLSPDELHMNDWSYGCVAKLLADSIVEAATRATVTATARGKR